MWKMTSTLLPTFRVTWPLKTPGIELSRFAVGLAAVGLAAVYFFYGRRKPKGCLDPERFQDFKLVRITRVSHNVGRFRFALPTPTSVFGLPVGQHIICRGKDDQGAEVIRPYTPITLDSDVGFFELVVKGRLIYKLGQAKAFGMLAGGTGITPMFQDELDGFARKFPNRFKVFYVLSQPPEAWNGGIGHISKEMIEKHCPAPAPDIQILRCGPPGMNKAMAGHLVALGYTPQMQFEF